MSGEARAAILKLVFLDDNFKDVAFHNGLIIHGMSERSRWSRERARVSNLRKAPGRAQGSPRYSMIVDVPSLQKAVEPTQIRRPDSLFNEGADGDRLICVVTLLRMVSSKR